MFRPVPLRRWTVLGGSLTALVCTLVALCRAQDADSPRLSLYSIDLDNGRLAQVADEPLPGHAYCGSPGWSFDGKRIVLDATPGRQWNKTRVLTTEFPGTGKRKFADLGPGNCPTWSPDAKRIAILLNPGAVSDAQPGLWIMNADGTERKRLADGALPRWSPDGGQILSVTFSNPCRLTLIDAETGASQPVALAGHEFYSVPSWAGDGQTLVAVVRAQAAASIVLIDVSEPSQAQIKRVLWTRGTGVSDDPIYPVYSAKTKCCVFIGRSTAGCALYLIEDKPGSTPMRIEPTVNDTRMAGLAISPDGRNVLFGSERKLEPPPREADTE